jgi:hypothetical protein
MHIQYNTPASKAGVGRGCIFVCYVFVFCSRVFGGIVSHAIFARGIVRTKEILKEKSFIISHDIEERRRAFARRFLFGVCPNNVFDLRRRIVFSFQDFAVLPIHGFAICSEFAHVAAMHLIEDCWQLVSQSPLQCRSV